MLETIAHFLPVLMFGSMVLLIFTGYPVAFVLGAIGVSFGLIGIVLDEFHMIQFRNVVPRIYRQTVENPVFVAIPLFVFMGSIMQRSRIAEDLLIAMQAVIGNSRGGLAIAVVAVGTVLAAMTGLIGASVAMIGLIALPLMIEKNYRPSFASGVVASAGTLGILIPPSIMLIIMGDILQIPVSALFAGAIVPGILLATAYIVFIFVASRLNPALAPRVEPAPGAPKGLAGILKLLRHLLPPLTLIALVLGSIYGGWATPTEAAAVGCTGALILAAMRGALSLGNFNGMMRDAALTVAMVYFVIFGATVFSYVFRVLGGDELAVEVLNALGLETGTGYLIALMVGVFILGFFFDWLEIILIMFPIFGPILMSADFSGVVEGRMDVMVWIAVLVAVNMQTSFLTPPFGFALFYLKGVAPRSVTMPTIYRGVIAFVLIQLFVLGLTYMWPELVLHLPRSWGLMF